MPVIIDLKLRYLPVMAPLLLLYSSKLSWSIIAITAGPEPLMAAGICQLSIRSSTRLAESGYRSFLYFWCRLSLINREASSRFSSSRHFTRSEKLEIFPIASSIGTFWDEFPCAISSDFQGRYHQEYPVDCAEPDLFK